MTKVWITMMAWCLALVPLTTWGADQDTERLAELNAYWTEVSRTVREGDFDGYKATCHPKGVLVSGTRKSSYPLSKALARWQQDFVNTRSGNIKADVTFRFSQRLNDETTAHETGMFLYATEDQDGKSSQEYIHFEALLVKEGSWKIMMEYQKSRGTRKEWEALK